MIPEQFWTLIKKVQRVHQRLYDSGNGWLIGWLVLLLHHTGRKSGRQFTTPLQYEKINGAYYVGAARGKHADWFRNVLVTPSVHVSVGRERFAAIAEPVTDVKHIADFLAYRLEKHPLMIGMMMKMHRLPMKPSRDQLEQLGGSISVVVLHPRKGAAAGS